MSNFARVHPLTGRVLNVIVAEQSVIDEFSDSEFWLETSKNTRGGILYDPATKQPAADQSGALRYNFASTGGHYNKEDDAFYAEKDFPSWVLNKTTYTWEAPIAKPSGAYRWDEDAYQADNTTGWVAVVMGDN